MYWTLKNSMKKKQPCITYIITGILIFLLLIGLDQWTKLLAVRHLKDQSPEILIPGILQLEYVENRGAAFGIFQDQIWIFLLIALLFLGAAFYVWTKMPKTKYYFPLHLILLFLTGGAVGNGLDRIFRGYVVDFVYFSLIDFPVFNVADIYVTVSAAVLILLILTKYRDDDFEFLKP